MTSRQKKLVQSTLDEIQPQSEAVATLFYGHLFDINPRLEKLFTNELRSQWLDLMQAISLAGGLGPFGAKRRLQVRRRGIGGDETIFAFDYRAYEAGYDLEGNVTLRPGDVVIVPERGLFE